MFATLQEELVQALLDPERPVPEALTSHTARRPDKRFAVYRNNVVVSLIAALAGRFPATRRIVGEEFFNAMARVYVTRTPPRSPILMRYGDDFAEFIAEFEPAESVPYLPDVARIEAARTRAYHAADATPVEPARLQAIEPDALADLRIVPHPSAGIVRSRHPAVTIWQINAAARPFAAIEDWHGEDALVIRPALEVQVHRLPPGGAAFLAVLFSGAALAAAAEAALAETAEFDLVANLAGMIEAGVIAGFSLPTTEKDTPS